MSHDNNSPNSVGAIAVLAAAATTFIAAVILTITGGAINYREMNIPRSNAALTWTQHSIVKWAIIYGPRSGIRYVWGGSSKYGFDCSGFAWYITYQRGVNIPRDSRSQFYSSTAIHVAKGNERPGDILYFHGSTTGVNSGPPPGHVGIYIGHDTYIAYYRTGYPALNFRLSQAQDYMGARRWWNVVQVPRRVYGTSVWIAHHFHVKIAKSHGYIVTFIPRRRKLVHWALNLHLQIHGNATHVNIKLH